jgi:hypothetical protein
VGRNAFVFLRATYYRWALKTLSQPRAKSTLGSISASAAISCFYLARGMISGRSPEIFSSADMRHTVD